MKNKKNTNANRMIKIIVFLNSFSIDVFNQSFFLKFDEHSKMLFD